jgi:hypothetical protein
MTDRDHLELVPDNDAPAAIDPRVADLEFRLASAEARAHRESRLREEADAQLAEARKEAAGGGQTRALGLQDASTRPQAKTTRVIEKLEQMAIDKGVAKKPVNFGNLFHIADGLKGRIDRKCDALEGDVRALSDLVAELEARLGRVEGRTDAD